MKQSARHSIERLFAEQYAALVAFFYRRTRMKADAPDLAQEVYLRMLRVKDLDAALPVISATTLCVDCMHRETRAFGRWTACASARK
jgi:hypothetical protein